MIKKMVFVVLFLFSTSAISVGNVHIYQDTGNIKTHLMAVKLCGKPIMYIYNHWGKTKILLKGNLSQEQKTQFKKYAAKMPKVGNKVVLPIVNIPCNHGISL